MWRESRAQALGNRRVWGVTSVITPLGLPVSESPPLPLCPLKGEQPVSSFLLANLRLGGHCGERVSEVLRLHSLQLRWFSQGSGSRGGVSVPLSMLDRPNGSQM